MSSEPQAYVMFGPLSPTAAIELIGKNFGLSPSVYQASPGLPSPAPQPGPAPSYAPTPAAPAYTAPAAPSPAMAPPSAPAPAPAPPPAAPAPAASAGDPVQRAQHLMQEYSKRPGIGVQGVKNLLSHVGGRGLAQLTPDELAWVTQYFESGQPCAPKA